MRRLFPHPWGWATVAPVLCAVHCAAAPLLVAFAPAFMVGEAAEWALFGVASVLVAWALSHGLRRHANPRPAVVIVVGLLAWAASLLHAFHPVPEEVTTVLASLTVALGLFWNARLDCATGETAACGECSVDHDMARASEGPEPGTAASTGAGTGAASPSTPVRVAGAWASEVDSPRSLG